MIRPMLAGASLAGCYLGLLGQDPMIFFSSLVLGICVLAS